MRILLDENVDRLLKGLFDNTFDVVTVNECGWSGMKNGELLRNAQQEFEAFVTMDQNLEHQQNVKILDLMIVVLRAQSNAYLNVSLLMPQVNEVLKTVQTGQVIHVTA